MAGGFYTNGKTYDSERSNALPLVRVFCSWIIAATMGLSSVVIQQLLSALSHEDPTGASGAVDPRHIRLEIPTGPFLVRPFGLLS